MGINAERPQRGQGEKGPGFAIFHPNLIPGCHRTPELQWWQFKVQVQVLALACLGTVWRVLVPFSEGSAAQSDARRGCDGNTSVLGQGRDDVCSSFLSPGQSPSAMEDLLDVENKRMADSLASKVTRLKSVSAEVTSGVDVKDELQLPAGNNRIVERFGLERTLRLVQSHPSATGRDTFH